MKSSLAIFFPLLGLVLSGDLAAQSARGSTQVGPYTRSYDVGELIAPMTLAFPQDEAHRSGMFLPVALTLQEALDSRRGESNENVVYGFPGPALDRESLLDLVADSRVASREGLQLWRDSLTFRGTQPRHERLRDLLLTLSHALHPRIRLEVSFLEGASVPERASLDSKDVDALLTGGKKRSVHRGVIRSDICELIRSGAHVNLILDWDAEVAQKATVYDPKVIRVELGMRLGLVASVLADGRIEILAGLQQSTPRGELKPVSLAGRGQGVMHHPRIDSRLVISRGVIRDGGALVLGGATGKHGLCVIRCHVEARDPNALSGRFQAIPLGDVLQPVPRVHGIVPPNRLGHEERDEKDDDVDVTESLRAAIGTDGNRESDWKLLGNHLLVLGEAGQDTTTRAISKRLHGLVQKRCATRHTLSIELRAGKVDNQLVASYIGGTTSLDDFANKVPRLGIVAALPGHPFQHIDGMETTFIRDLQVEIAAKATASNPVIYPAFSGTSVVGTLRRGLTGGLTLDGSFYHALVDTVRLDAGEPTARDIDTVSRQFVRQQIRSVPVRRGRWQVLSLLESPTKDGHVVFVVRVAK